MDESMDEEREGWMDVRMVSRDQTDYERYIWKGATYSLPNTKHSLPNMELYVLLKGIC